MKHILIFIFIFTLFIDAKPIIDEFGCETYLKQIMKPEYPLTDHQGYAIIGFKINSMGDIENTRIVESMCVTTRDDNGDILFRKCPFFINKSLIAAKYIKFKPPVNKDKSSCEIRDHRHRYTFSIYNPLIEGNNFILRGENSDQE